MYKFIEGKYIQLLEIAINAVHKFFISKIV